MRMRPVGRYLDETDRKLVAHYVAGLKRPMTVDMVKGNVAQGDLKYALCQTCHGPKTATAGSGARSGCTECHRYHLGVPPDAGK